MHRDKNKKECKDGIKNVLKKERKRHKEAYT